MKYGVFAAGVFLSMISIASAGFCPGSCYVDQYGFNEVDIYGRNNWVIQPIYQEAYGSYIDQYASNSALVYGSGNEIIQHIRQNAYGDYVNQHAFNEAVIYGSGNYVDQTIDQRSPGTEVYLRQSGFLSSGYMRQSASTTSAGMVADVRIGM